nr:hypothetical protein [Deinococcus budaensis]
MPWLLRWQTRWAWQGLGLATRRGLIAGLIFAALLGVGGFFLLRSLLSGLPLGGPLPDAALGPLTLGLAFVFTLTLSASVTAALEALYTRGDLDLLLHSPVAPRTVLASRALGVALSGALGSALLIVPVTFLLAVLGAWRGLGLLGWWLGAALLAAALGLWLTLGLVRALGVRRARVTASVVGALLGASLFLTFQLPNILGRGGGSDVLLRTLEGFAPGRGGWPERASPLWWPARAVWSEPGPLLAVTLGPALVFALGLPALTRLFLRGVAASAEGGGGQRRAAQAAAGPLRFRPARQATLLKEWRMVGRDPELLSRTLLQLVYLLPLLASAWRGSVGGAASAGIVLLGASLASALAHLTLNAEDAPDLLVTAPRSPAALRRDKWLAAALPPLTLGVLGVGVFAARDLLAPGLALALLGLVALGVAGSALLVLWRPLPVRRADAFKTRPGNTLGQTLLTLLFQGGLSLGAYALARGQAWSLAPLLAAGVALAVAYGGRGTDAR